MHGSRSTVVASGIALVAVVLATQPAAAEGQVVSSAKLTDGELRVRVTRARGRVDLTLFFRSALDGTPGQHQRPVRGWGLRLDGDRAYFVKIGRDGALRRHGGISYLRGARRFRTLELVVWLHGRQIVAGIFDRRLRRRFAVLALRADAPVEGQRLGLITGRRAGPTRIVRLTTRPLCQRDPGARRRARGSAWPPRIYATVKRYAGGARAVVERTRAGALVLRTDLTRLETMVCGGARLLAVSPHRPWKYVGAGVEYLARRDRPPATGPGGVPIIGRSYKNPAMVEALLRAWHRRYPRRTRLVTLGRSDGGRPLQALFIGDGVRAADPRPTVLLNGGHHGTEPLSVELVLDAIQVLLGETALARRLRREVVVCAVPVVNPDGLHHYLEVSLQMGRKNGRDLNRDGIVGVYEGVDLNRNYPFGWRVTVEGRGTRRPDWHYYRGPAPASEPEVKAMIALAERERFVASVSYHSGAIALHLPYTVSGAASPVPDEAGVVAREIARGLGTHPQGRRFAIRRRIASVSGTDQDYYRHAHGTVALLVEAARRTPRPGRERDKVVAALRPSWRLLLQRYLDGPTIWGHVRDAAGRPVEAEVRLREVKLRAKERWTSRPRDGRFDRILARPGRYGLQVLAAGYRPVERTVEVGRRQRRRVEIRLPSRRSSR